MRCNRKPILAFFCASFFFVIVFTRNNWCCIFQENLIFVNEKSLLALFLGNDVEIDFNGLEKEEVKSEAHSSLQDKVMAHKEVEESVRKTCSKRHLLPKSFKQLTKRQRSILLNHLIVDDDYKFIYCYTPKVACSNWKRLLKQLSGTLKKKDFVSMDHHNGITTLAEYSIEEIKKRLETYHKFMFVRNPTERALSGYRNKFNEVEAYYKVHGSKIMSMYHEHSPTYEGKVPGDDVSFQDLLRYLATGVRAEDMDEHFAPLTTLCQPCLVKYDFIGVYDNIAKDSETVLRNIQAPTDLHFPARQQWYKPTTDAYLHYYYSLISPPLLASFVHKYSLDYEMFSFPKPYFSKAISQFQNRTFHIK